MTSRIDRLFRLEAWPGDLDVGNGFAARIHDPLWLLARQWQMGEHRGENASTPVRVEFGLREAPLRGVPHEPCNDPAQVPAEALVETEADPWWTMGRRVRAGVRLAARAAVAAADGLRFADPAPPYDAFRGAVDGLLVWRVREDLGLDEADFGEDAPPPSPAPGWNSRRLAYAARFESAAGTLAVAEHRGGAVDWWSADVDGAAQDMVATAGTAIPAPLEYPGAPHRRFWEIEDARTDIGGFPPDASSFPTMLLIELVYAHGDDWFLFPVRTAAGRVVRLDEVVVTDSFGKPYPGLAPPDDFGLFRTDGLPRGTLVAWSAAEGLLESEPLDRVQFGLDEEMNLLWALERTADGREVGRRPLDDVAHPPFHRPVPPGDLEAPRGHAYVPAAGIEGAWHPYRVVDEDGWRAFRLAGLADLSRQEPVPMPWPTTAVLAAEDPARLHRIDPDVVTAGGFEIERRFKLARRMDGRPVLWIERQRRPLRSPPARTLRFDVMEETAAP